MFNCFFFLFSGDLSVNSFQTMKILPASFIVLSTVCVAVCGFNNRSPIGDCPGCRKIDVISFEPLKRVAMIKAEILRRLGISQQQSGNPSAHQSQQPTAFPKMRQKNTDVETPGNVIKADDTQELSELLSYSEIPGKMPLNFRTLNL